MVAYGTPLKMGAAELQYSVLVLGSQAGCSGVAIGPRHVVTAATCLGRFDDLQTEPRYILESKIEVISFAGERPQTIRATAAVMHPFFKIAAVANPFSITDMASTDIALITLEKPLLSDGAKIARPEQTLSTPLKLTGFGADENEVTTGRPRTAVGKPGWSGARLDNGYGIVGFIRGDGVPCAGDLGAPALSDGLLVGLVSMVRKESRTVVKRCVDTQTSTLADVRYLRGWLKCSAEQLKAPLAQLSDAQADSSCEKNSIISYNR